MTVRMEISTHATAGSFALSRQRARRPPRLEQEFSTLGSTLRGVVALWSCGWWTLEKIVSTGSIDGSTRWFRKINTIDAPCRYAPLPIPHTAHFTTARSLQPAAYCLLPAAYYWLPTTGYWLLATASCLLPTAYCTYCTYCLLPTPLVDFVKVG